MILICGTKFVPVTLVYHGYRYRAPISVIVNSVIVNYVVMLADVIAEAHTVTGEDTHGSGGLQVCGPARSLQTGTGSCGS
jgi:hypothetical protein